MEELTPTPTEAVKHQQHQQLLQTLAMGRLNVLGQLCQLHTQRSTTTTGDAAAHAPAPYFQYLQQRMLMDAYKPQKVPAEQHQKQKQQQQQQKQQTMDADSSGAVVLVNAMSAIASDKTGSRDPSSSSVSRTGSSSHSSYGTSFDTTTSSSATASSACPTRVFCISDLHVDQHGGANMELLSQISTTKFKNDVLLVAGGCSSIQHQYSHGLSTIQSEGPVTLVK